MSALTPDFFHKVFLKEKQVKPNHLSPVQFPFRSVKKGGANVLVNFTFDIFFRSVFIDTFYLTALNHESMTVNRNTYQNVKENRIV